MKTHKPIRLFMFALLALIAVALGGAYAQLAAQKSGGPSAKKTSSKATGAAPVIAASRRRRPCSTGHSSMCVKGLTAGTGMFEDGTDRLGAVPAVRRPDGCPAAGAGRGCRGGSRPRRR